MHAARVPGGLSPAWAIALSLFSGPAIAQGVSEDIHSLADGPTDICGIVAQTALEFITAVHRDPRFGRAELESDRFELYVSADGWTQWVATLPGEPAYPAITCRHAWQDDAGTWQMTRRMRCDGSRAKCDALFLEFQALDRAMTDEVRRTAEGRTGQP